MPSAHTIRLEIESALAHKIPSALTPAAKTIRPVMATGIEMLDSLLHGGLPIGALTELIGPDCSGRTSIAASFLARITQANKVCAWIDISNTFDPIAAAATGLDLERLLWIRCGAADTATQPSSQRFRLPEQYLVASAARKGLHGGSLGPHPRSEVKGMSQAVGSLLRSETATGQDAAPQRQVPAQSNLFDPGDRTQVPSREPATKPWARIEQGLRTADLLLQAGGFSAIVLDMASLAPEFVSRVPLATWHRYRLASERTQSSILLLTQHSCAKSSAELLLQLRPYEALCEQQTLFTGTRAHIEVLRRRFPAAQSNVVPLKKTPQSANTASWQCRAAWTAQR